MSYIKIYLNIFNWTIYCALLTIWTFCTGKHPGVPVISVKSCKVIWTCLNEFLHDDLNP